jgi:hypothetical protein
MQRRLILAVFWTLLFLTFGVRLASAADDVQEYTDHQYGFAFQFPSDWNLQTTIQQSELGEMRAIAKHPTKPIYVAAIVGILGTSVSQSAFAANSSAKQIVDQMIALTLKEVYQKSAESQHLENMKVAETTEVASNTVIEFYISTFSVIQGKIVSMAGLHAVPFDKPYMISFIEVAPVDPAAREDNDAVRRTFNSFHLLGDSPLR